MFRATILCSALLLGACTYQAKVPLVDGSSLANVGGQQPGAYSAIIQTGGWNMNTEVVGWTCSANTYQADLNPSWDAAMRSALSSALQKVDFATTVSPPSKLVSAGYDAEIDIMQSNASSKVRVNQRPFFGADATSETRLEGILAINFADGARQQQPIDGHGLATEEAFTCGQAGPAIEQSSALAIRDIVQKAMLTTKLLLAQHGPRRDRVSGR